MTRCICFVLFDFIVMIFPGLTIWDQACIACTAYTATTVPSCRSDLDFDRVSPPSNCPFPFSRAKTRLIKFFLWFELGLGFAASPS